MNDRFADMLAALAGGRADVLAVVTGARAKFMAMGAVVLATAGIAALSAGFAARMALDAPLPAAAAIGAGWGVVILTIDRALMVGMANQPSLGRNLLIAAPRVALALILGTVISTPITLQIFHHETDTVIRAIQREAADEFRRQLDADARFTVIPQLERDAADAKARVTSGGGTDPAVKDKQAAYDAALAAYQRLQEEAQCELNGTCGTGHAGTGDAYYSARDAAERQLVTLNAAKRELDAAAARSTTQASADQKAAEDQLNALRTTRQDLQTEFDQRNNDNTGLLIRLEALERLGAQRPLLGAAHALLWAMFTCIELLPVLVKLLMNIGAASEYDRVQKSQDGGDADVFDDQMRAWKDAQHTRAQVGVHQAQRDAEVERYRIDQEKAQDLLAVDRVIQVQAKAVQAFLDVWGEDALHQIGRQRDEFARGLTQRRLAAPSRDDTTPVPTTVPAASRAPRTPRRGCNGATANDYLTTAQLPDGSVL